ncbi:vWA domain-containing protein [Streptomyces sp. NPDC088725]|uniref:vWA domain-containing protein n=1 Tax=Streptomyces sp. NPDC088725 TaxID=3365873 RepID=UPI00382C0F4C
MDKQVLTPAIPPKPEVVFLVDGTASTAGSDGPLRNVRNNLDLITPNILNEQPDSHFAVATFEDQEGDVPDAGFQRIHSAHGRYDESAGRRRQAGDRLGPAERGLSEDWINGLWQIANVAGGTTVFREGASPVIVLLSDVSSHSPSNGHSIDDTITALQDNNIRVIGVDIASTIGDGLDGDGNAHDPDNPGYIENPPTTPGQATASSTPREGTTWRAWRATRSRKPSRRASATCPRASLIASTPATRA